MHKLSRKNRLILYLSVLLIVGFGLTSLLSYQVSRTAIHDGIIRNQLPLVGDNVYSEIQRDLLRPVFISSVMAQDAFLRDWVLDGEKDELQVRRFLKEIRDRYKTVTSFFVSDKTGTYYHSSGILKTVSEDDSRDAWYYRVRDMEPRYEINVDVDAANADAMTIFVNYKMIDYEGNFIGATGVGLTVTAVGDLIKRYQSKFQRHIYFVDSSGDVVLPRPTSDSQLHNIHQTGGMQAHATRILNEKTTGLRYQEGGSTHFVSSRFIPELNWVLIVEQSDAEAIGDLNNTLLINLGISFLVTVIILALTLVAINAYNKALLEAAESAKDINQRLSRLNRQKNKLLSIIGHDLRAPFTAFLGVAELLKSRALKLQPKEVASYADDVLVAGRNAYGVLDSLLNWAVVRWEDMDPEPEVIDIAEIVGSGVEIYAAIAGRKDIELVWLGHPPLKVLSDRDMVNLMIRNLIDNAIKFTSAGGTVTVDVSRDDKMVWVAVRDTGSGMSADQLAKLSGSEQAVSTAGTGGEVGIGMGLSLCREMVAVNGGELQIESEEGKGSVFRFSLPVAESLASEAT